MNSLSLLRGPLRSVFFVTHKLGDAKEPVKALQLMAGKAEICQIPETSLILSSAWALLVFYRHSL